MSIYHSIAKRKVWLVKRDTPTLVPSPKMREGLFRQVKCLLR